MLWYGKAISAEWIKKGTEGNPGGKDGLTFKLWAFKVSIERARRSYFQTSNVKRAFFLSKHLTWGTSHTCNLQRQNDFTQNKDSSLMLGAHSQALKKEKRQTTTCLFPLTRHCDALAQNF